LAAVPSRLNIDELKAYPFGQLIHYKASTMKCSIELQFEFGNKLMLAYAPTSLQGRDITRDPASLAKLPAELQQLVWLEQVIIFWPPIEYGPLSTFFSLPHGDYAPEIARSLSAARMTHQASALSRAMGAFEPPYPSGFSARLASLDASRELVRLIAALDPEFGDLESYKSGVEAFVRSTPVLMQWAHEARGTLTDDDRLRFVALRLRQAARRDGQAGMAEWPKVCRDIVLLADFNDEMLNGSVEQFFYNPSGDAAPETARALRDAGLTKHAQAVETGIGRFGDPYPDHTVRRAFLRRDGEATDLSTDLDALTGDVDDGEMLRAMQEMAMAAGIWPA
jgi:hypothetical protein